MKLTAIHRAILRSFGLITAPVMIFLVSANCLAQQAMLNPGEFPFQDPSVSLSERVDDLVSRLLLEEKVSQMQHKAAAIPRLGIPAYNWWNECLHGVARNGIATVFPQAIGMAATWNPDLIHHEADIISTEARAKYAEAISKGQHGIYQGLTFWSPNINIFRDPRWGRGQETYGEDPCLTATIGKAFVKGLQGDHPKYYKVIATAKHFAVHSGPEPERHRFDAWPSANDLYMTYLPAFEALVKEAGVYSVMTCYNRVYGTPSSASTFLFREILRGKWGFKGYVVSDCWAISDMYSFHNYVPTPEKAVTLTLKAGTDLSCGPEYQSLIKAVESGYLPQAYIDQSVKRLFEARFRLGLFDPPSNVPYTQIKPGDNNSTANSQFALEVARQSIVLLKNENNILPISPRVKTIAVIGPYATDTAVLLGNYNGIPSAPVTLFQGICNQAGKSVKVLYSKGVERPEVLARMDLTQGGGNENDLSTIHFDQALKAAERADVIIFTGGISPNLEGEEMDVKVEGFKGGDRTSLEMPREQVRLLEALKNTCKPVVLVLTNGSALAVNWAQQNIPAIVEAWYPGQQGGNAIGEVLFGKYNPAGRLPVTFYKSVEDLPPFEDYSMKGRTYRYFSGPVLYPFGYGLSYSQFEYSGFTISEDPTKGDVLLLKVNVKNISSRDGDEVVQFYLKHPESVPSKPVISLIAFSRINVPAGKTSEVIVEIPRTRLRHYDPNLDDYRIFPGRYSFQAGASSADIRLVQDFEIK